MSDRIELISTGNETPAELSGTFQRAAESISISLEEFLSRFSQAINNLPDSQRSRTLNDLATVDLRRHSLLAANADQISADDYAAILKTHGVKPDAELVAEEFRLRLLKDARCKPTEYAVRFPQLWKRLEPMLVAISVQHELDVSSPSQIETSNPQETMPVATSDTGEEAVPKKIDRFTILQRLGRGGMGDVYLAEDPKLDRKIALKIPRFSQGNADAMQRFFREAKLAAAIQHPNLCPIHEIGEADGQTFICMGYVEGETLSDIVRRDGSLPVDQAVDVTRKLATVLSEAHEAGILHRDLKPGNVMLDHRGEVILMDFGLATQLDHDPDAARLTSEGTSLGSPAYMSPEQVSGVAENYSPATDVYGLGACLYEMLTGRPPFTGSIGEVLASAMSATPVRPGKHRSEVNRQLDAVVMKMLAKTPGDRWQTMDEVVSALAPLTSSSAAELKPQAGFWSPTRIATAIALTLIAAILAGVIYIETGKGTVRLNIKDPECKVSVDGEEIVVVDGESVMHRIYPGDHTLDIKRGDMQFETQQFSLKRRGKVVFDVELVDRKLILAKGGEPLAIRMLDPTNDAKSEQLPTKPNAANVVEVSPNGAGDTLTLAEAIKQAKPGQTLNLARGIYPIGNDIHKNGDGHYRIRTPNLTIKGNRSKIESTIFQDAPNLVVEDLECWMFSQGESDSRRHDLTIRNCRIPRIHMSGHSDPKILIENCVAAIAGGYRAKVTIDHCTLTGSYDNGAALGNEFYFNTSYDVTNSIVTGVDNAFVANSAGTSQVHFQNCLLYSPTDVFVLFGGKDQPRSIEDGTRQEVALKNSNRLQGFEFSDCILGQDPKFLRRLTPNYHVRDCRLRADSPAIGMAVDGKDMGAIPDEDGWPFVSPSYESTTPDRLVDSDSATSSMEPQRFWQPDSDQKKWLERTALLPAEKKVRAVNEKLQDVNSGLSAKLNATIIEGVVTEASIADTKLRHIWPIQAFTNLQKLLCRYSIVSDLSQIRALKLTDLTMSFSAISDLRPLQDPDSKLAHLKLLGSPVVDLTPVRDLPLQSLRISQTLVHDLSPLKSKSIYMISMYEIPIAGPEQLEGLNAKVLGLKIPLHDERWNVALFDNRVQLKVSGTTDPMPPGELFNLIGRKRNRLQAIQKQCESLAINERLPVLREAVKEFSTGNEDAQAPLYVTLADGTEHRFFGNDFSPLIALPEIRELSIDHRGLMTDMSWIRDLKLQRLNVTERSLLSYANMFAGMPWTATAEINYRPARREISRALDKLKNPRKYVERYNSLARTIEDRGGKLIQSSHQIDASNPSTIFVPEYQLQLPDKQVFLDEARDISNLRSIFVLNCENTPVSEEQLKLVANMSNLRTLILTNDELTDAGILELERLPFLASIYFNDQTKYREEALLNLPCFDRLKNIGLASPVTTDATLKRIANFPHVEFLGLHRTNVTDEGLKLLGENSGVRQIQLGNTAISDEGLVNLHRMPKLRDLQLFSTRITDDGLPHLAKIKTLKNLDIRFMNTITAEGIAKLRKALPDCEVLWDGD